MEEKNELNDIILNKGGSNTGSKKLLLAIATLTLVLIIVLVIMNSLKNDEVQKAPQAILPPEPTAPTEIINDPLFEPVEVIQEGTAPAQGKNLDQVAQKIKDEAVQNAPAAQKPAPVPAASVQPSVPAQTPKATTLTATAPMPKTTPMPAQSNVPVAMPQPKKEAPTVVQSAPVQPVVKPAPAKIVKAAATPKPVAEKPVTAKKPEPKVEPKAEAKTEVKAEKKPEAAASPAATSQATYYIQVGSFSQEPNKALFDRLNASGMKYTTQKSGSVTKILVGPFQGEKSVNDAMGSVRQNIEPKAFRIKG